MKIALDAMGGDYAPAHTIQGAIMALQEFEDLELLHLLGEQSKIEEELSLIPEAASLKNRYEIIHTDQVVEMNEAPTVALRGKKNSSVTLAADLVKQGEAQALVSAGNTGAAVAASTVKLRNIPGVERAGIATPIPNEFGVFNLIDAGANPEAKAFHLLQYAIMGTVYAKHVLKKPEPIVGLMSVGEEDHKGTEFTKEVFHLLKESNLNFHGNIEGTDLYETKLDVIVCDGFVGNVILKVCEATAKIIFKWVKEEIEEGNPMRKMGALMAKGAFKAVHERGNYENYGGSPLLGVNGTCIIAHGSSSALAIKNALRAARSAVRQEVNPHIEEEIAKHLHLKGS